MASGRCADCGFLAVRDTQSRALVEIELGMLASWVIPKSHLIANTKQYDEMPICFVRAAKLNEEVGSFTPDKVIKVIEEPRDCPRFTPRRHGRSPKEHADIEYAHELRQFQQEQRERDAERQDRRDGEQRAWQEQQSAAERRLRARLVVFNIIVTAIVSIISIIAGVVIRSNW